MWFLIKMKQFLSNKINGWEFQFAIKCAVSVRIGEGEGKKDNFSIVSTITRTYICKGNTNFKSLKIDLL